MTSSAGDLPSLWVRVDDRLIHGQVTVGWRQHLRYDEIWVVDDLVCGDPYLQDALRLAAPPEVEVRVYSVAEAVALWASNARPSHGDPGAAAHPLLLLVKSPQIALALVEGGVPLDRLNVGNLAARPGSRRVYKNISLTPEHVAALETLAGRGVHITFQLTPDDPQVDWPHVRRRLNL